jgi:hypothetical protein
MSGNMALLKHFLEDGHIIKAGVNAVCDKTKLEEAMDVTIAAVVNLSKLATETHVVTKCRMSLQDMVRVILGKHLDKPESIRVSAIWKDVKNLRSNNGAAIQYAALDALASASLYDAIVEGQNPVFKDYCPAMSEVGKKVYVCNASETHTIAVGVVIEDPSNAPTFLGHFTQKVTAHRAVVKLLKILIPSAIASVDLTSLHDGAKKHKQELAHMQEHHNGVILVRRSDLRAASDEEVARLISAGPVASHVNAAVAPRVATAESSSSTTEERLTDELARFYLRLSRGLQENLAEPESVIKGDVFHLLKGILDTCKKKHPCFNTFASLLGDAVLVPVQSDVKMVEDALRTNGLTSERLGKDRMYQWKDAFLRYSRRSSGPSRLQQLHRFDQVVALCVDMIDPTKGNEPLIREKTKNKLEAARLKISLGYYTDPSNVDLYHLMGKDKAGRPLYSCCRGTNGLEGFHRHLRSLVGRHFCSPVIAYNLLREYMSRWNIKRARSLRGRGDHCLSSTDQGDIEEVNMLSLKLFDKPMFKNVMCTYDFQDTGETFGIIRDPTSPSSLSSSSALLNNVILIPLLLDSDGIPTVLDGAAGDKLIAASGVVSDGDEDDEVQQELHSLDTAGNKPAAHSSATIGANEELEEDAWSNIGLSKAAKWLARKEGSTIVVRDFHLDNSELAHREKQLFYSLLSHATHGRNRSAGYCFETMAMMWNRKVSEEESELRRISNVSGGNKTIVDSITIKYYRKTESQLEAFYVAASDREARHVATAPFVTQVQSLRDILRSTEGVVQTGGIPLQPTAKSTASSPSVPNSDDARFNTMASTVPAAIFSSTIQRIGNGATTSSTESRDRRQGAVLYNNGGGGGSELSNEEQDWLIQFNKVVDSLLTDRANGVQGRRLPKTCGVCGH